MSNPLKEIIQAWWQERQVEILSLSTIEPEYVFALVLGELTAMRDNPDDVSKRAEAFPNRCLLEISKKCPSAPAEDKLRCMAHICELLALCLLFQGDYDQREASPKILAKVDEKTCRKDMLNALLPHVEAAGAAALQEWLKAFWQEEDADAPESNLSAKPENPGTISIHIDRVDKLTLNDIHDNASVKA